MNAHVRHWIPCSYLTVAVAPVRYECGLNNGTVAFVRSNILLMYRSLRMEFLGPVSTLTARCQAPGIPIGFLSGIFFICRSTWFYIAWPTSWILLVETLYSFYFSQAALWQDEERRCVSHTRNIIGFSQMCNLVMLYAFFNCSILALSSHLCDCVL